MATKISYKLSKKFSQVLHSKNVWIREPYDFDVKIEKRLQDSNGSPAFTKGELNKIKTLVEAGLKELE